MSDLPGYLLYRAFAALFGLLPEPAMRRTGVALGSLAHRVARDRRRLVRRHMRRVLGPDATGDTVERAAREMFEAYGRYWAEVFWTRPRRVDDIFANTTVDRPEIIERARDGGKGVILALPHLGNWEAAGPQTHHLGIPALAVAEALPNRRIVDWFLRTRETLGIDVIVPGLHDNISGRLRSRLESGGTIALVADRDVTGSGVEVEFFGEKTTMPAGPVTLAIRTGAPIIPVGCYFREGPGHDFRICDPLEIPREGSMRDRLQEGTQRLAGVFEELIGRAPPQWHLFQPNWPSDTEVAE